MVEKVSTFDRWLLDNVFQKTADYLWGRWPINCFSLAKAALLVWSMAWIIRSFGFTDSVFTPFWSLVFVSVIAALDLILISVVEFMSKGRYNVARDSQFIVRMMMLCNLIMLIFVYGAEFTIENFLFLVAQVAQFTQFYFVSCQLRPPVKRTKREWIRKLVPIGT